MNFAKTIPTNQHERPCAVLGVPAELYRQQAGITQSELNLFGKSPLLFRHGRGEATKAMELGSVVHSSVLEASPAFHIRPETYGPDSKPWNGNATLCKEWLASHTDKPVIKGDEAATVFEAVNKVHKHETCAAWLRHGNAEVSIFAKFGKGRLDYIADRGGWIDVVDVKTTSDGRHRKFQSAIMEYGYHIQAAWYRRLVAELSPKPIKYRFIVLELEPVVRINCWTLAEQAIDLGDERVDWLLERLEECREKNRWPDYHNADMGETGDIDLPEYAYPDEILID
mgnify:FL=1